MKKLTLARRCGAAAFAIFFAAHARSDAQFIGGPDVIPINPDFGGSLDLTASGATRGFLRDLSGGGGFTAQQSLVQNLTAELSSTLSASNRPSVLTPYLPDTEVLADGTNYNESFGSFITNKANTIGAGNFGVGVSYSGFKFDKFDGESLADHLSRNELSRTDLTVSDINLHATDLIGTEIPAGYHLGVPHTAIHIVNGANTIPVNVHQILTFKNVQITANVVTLALTYGLMDRLDVGALVPYVFLNTHGSASYNYSSEDTLIPIGLFPDTDPTNSNPIYQTNVHFSGTAPEAHGKWDRDYEGLGDVILFTKLAVLSQTGRYAGPGILGRKAPLDLALQFEVKTPTGDEDKFLGSGEWDFAVRGIGQREFIPGALRGRAELGYNFSGLGDQFSTLDMKLGGEVVPFALSKAELDPRLYNLSLSAEIISRRSDEFGFVIDGVFGGKYNFAPKNMTMFAGVRVPIADNGLTFKPSPIIGFEYAFKRPIDKLKEKFGSKKDDGAVTGSSEPLPAAAPAEGTSAPIAPQSGVDVFDAATLAAGGR